MKLLACGTAAGPMSANRAASGYVLAHDGRSIMLDCGPGSLRQAMRLGVRLPDIEAVVLSHLHLDHGLDLATYAYLLRYQAHWPAPAIYGPPGTRAFVEQVATFGEPNNRPCPFQTIVEIEASDEREIAGFVVKSVETKHAPYLRAYSRRFEAGGRSLVFTGDTSANRDVIAGLARDADVLLHECYSHAGLIDYVADRPDELKQRVFEAFEVGHCLVEDAARNAVEAGARRLILTHFLAEENPESLLATARSIFSGEVIAAEDGLTMDI